MVVTGDERRRGERELSRRLEAMTRVAQDTERAAVGAAERLEIVAGCLAAVEGATVDDAVATLEGLADPVTRRILRARFDAPVHPTEAREADGAEHGTRWRQVQDAARALHVEARELARSRRREADRMEALRQAAESALSGAHQPASAALGLETSR